MNPGWYPDPDDTDARRYWDGDTWSAPLKKTAAAPESSESGERSQPPRGKKLLLWGVAATVAVVAIAAVVLFLVLRDDKDDDVAKVGGFGVTAGSVADRLGTCSTTKRIGKGTIRCVTATGGYVGITTSDTKDEQEFLVALLKDRNSGDCVVVLPGVLISAARESTLIEAVGVPEQFANDNDGYVLCPVS